MPSDFWTRKLAGITTPRPQPQPQNSGAWWQAPVPQETPHPGITGTGFGQYGQPLGYNPALQAQMPGPGPGQRDQYVRSLLGLPAEQLSQDQMEEIARYELDSKVRYNQACPQCGSANFAPKGTRLGTTTLGSDKCFECGASSSTHVSSPEPATGGGASRAAYKDIRQIDTGGAAGSMYMKFNGVPSGYMPRGS